MTEFALLVDGQLKEIRQYAEKPADIPHKKVAWHPVVREYGQPYEGLESGAWVIRTVDPATLPPPVPRSITRRQCALQLRASGMITMDEAKAMAKDGTMPAAIVAHLDGAVQQGNMTVEQRDLAEIDFAAVNYYRNNPLLLLFGLTSQQLDQFFIAAAQL